MRIPIIGAAIVMLGGGALAAEPTGVWLSESGDTQVEIAPCGDVLCGTIVAAKGNGKDEKNPDAAKRGQPLVGVRMIWDMAPSGDGYSGKLYNYTNGKVYSGKVEPEGDTMKLSGCVAGGLFCRSQTWTRVK